MKKISLFTKLGLCTALAAALLSGCSNNSNSETVAATASETTGEAGKASYTIGVTQIAEHGSLDNCREGFL